MQNRPAFTEPLIYFLFKNAVGLFCNMDDFVNELWYFCINVINEDMFERIMSRQCFLPIKTRCPLKVVTYTHRNYVYSLNLNYYIILFSFTLLKRSNNMHYEK